jgi:hypothetical protein
MQHSSPSALAPDPEEHSTGCKAEEPFVVEKGVCGKDVTFQNLLGVFGCFWAPLLQVRNQRMAVEIHQQIQPQSEPGKAFERASWK